MTWRNTQYEDLHRIKLEDDPSDADIRSLLPDTDATRELLEENARTWWEEEEVLAIVGVAPLWEGVGTVWTLLSAASRQRGVLLTRGVLRFIDLLHQGRGYRRLQATVELGDEIAQLWIIRLGFKYESTMVAYGPGGETHDMYVRLRG